MLIDIRCITFAVSIVATDLSRATLTTKSTRLHLHMSQIVTVQYTDTKHMRLTSTHHQLSTECMPLRAFACLHVPMA